MLQYTLKIIVPQVIFSDQKQFRLFFHIVDGKKMLIGITFSPKLFGLCQHLR